MKNGMKLLALGATIIGAAAGVAAYRKYRDSYEQLPDEAFSDGVVFEEENDFEQIVPEEDDFTIYIEDSDQILFHE